MVEDSNNKPKVPKLFISYSWTNPNHVDWVMQLATDLRENGVEAIIDQWHLKEGQDSHSFMEQMVHDEQIEKVVLVCDEKYVDRANSREGGVGVESQIITQKIFGDVSQTKFVALALSSTDNGDALLPNFLSSRIYIDFRNTDEYAQSLKNLLRWTFDKPLHALPSIGEPPKFLDEQVSFQPISIGRLRSIQESTASGERGFLALWREVLNKHTDFTIDLSGNDEGDQIVIDAIEALPPLLSQLIVSVRDRAEIGEFESIETDALIQFFERCLSNYNKGQTSWSGDVTKFFTEFLFVSIISIILRYRRFKTLKNLLETPIIKMDHDKVTARTISITRINESLNSLAFRNKRLSLNRASLHADIVQDICKKVPLEFWEYLQADYYLFLYFDRSSDDGRWWPDSNIYATDHSGAFPLFARATYPELRDGLLSALNLASKAEIEQFSEDIKVGRYQNIRWRSAFSQLEVWKLGNFDTILGSYS